MTEMKALRLAEMAALNNWLMYLDKLADCPFDSTFQEQVNLAYADLVAIQDLQRQKGYV